MNLCCRCDGGTEGGKDRYGRTYGTRELENTSSDKDARTLKTRTRFIKRNTTGQGEGRTRGKQDQDVIKEIQRDRVRDGLVENKTKMYYKKYNGTG